MISVRGENTPPTAPRTTGVRDDLREGGEDGSDQYVSAHHRGTISVRGEKTQKIILAIRGVWHDLRASGEDSLVNAIREPLSG